MRSGFTVYGSEEFTWRSCSRVGWSEPVSHLSGIGLFTMAKMWRDWLTAWGESSSGEIKPANWIRILYSSKL
jgi:hypothetical protein